MIFGVTTWPFHVVLSLIGILSEFVVMFGLLFARRLDAWTAVLLATLLTSVTGFLFPFRKFLPSYRVGVVSPIILALVIPETIGAAVFGHPAYSHGHFHRVGDFRGSGIPRRAPAPGLAAR